MTAAMVIAPDLPRMAFTSLLFSVGSILAPVAAITFADFEVQICQVRKNSDNYAHQHADGVPCVTSLTSDGSGVLCSVKGSGSPDELTAVLDGVSGSLK